MQRIKKGDTVSVIAGKDLGVTGQVKAVYPEENRVLIDGVNIVKRHQKARQQGNQTIPAQIVSKESPIDLSNVMLVCPSCNKRTRVGYRVNEAGRKVRVCKKCNSDIE